MRKHGLPKFPDPNSQGDLFITPENNPGGPNSPTYLAAQKACQSLQPGFLSTPAEKATANAKALAYARCIRAHGIVNFPDPNGQGLIVISAASNVAEGSPEYDKAQKACKYLAKGFNVMTRT
jgi:hypothetical protein